MANGSIDYKLGEITRAIKDIEKSNDESNRRIATALKEIQAVIEKQDSRIQMLERFRWLMAGGIAVMSFLATFIYNFLVGKR